MEYVGIDPIERGRDTANVPGEQSPSVSNDMSISGTSSGPSSVEGSEGRRVTGVLAAGQLLSERYRVVQLMGKGGFGAVYKANDERFKAHRVVAIKEMSDAHLNPDERAQALKDFRQEANLLVQLSHANLPAVSDFFEGRCLPAGTVCTVLPGYLPWGKRFATPPSLLIAECHEFKRSEEQ